MNHKDERRAGENNEVDPGEELYFILNSLWHDGYDQHREWRRVNDNRQRKADVSDAVRRVMALTYALADWLNEHQ